MPQTTRALRLPLLAGLLAALAPNQQLAPAARLSHVMTTAGPGGGVFLLGGAPTPDGLWRFVNGAWQRVSEAGPVARSLPALAYDSRRDLVVLYGGAGSRNGSRYGDVWEWDGSRWSERDVRTPGPRDHHAMAYDEARGQVVMFGGMKPDASFPGDTWTWDGTVWVRADTVTGPGGLGHHAMAYDKRRQRVVLFGGDAPNKPATDDVWEWDGASWHRVTATGPGPGARARHRLAFDEARGVVVLFGGQIGNGPTAVSPSDTWTWDGRVWTRVDSVGPSPRYMPAMAYDEKSQRVVLFGGGNASRPYNSLGDTWEWDGRRWNERR